MLNKDVFQRALTKSSLLIFFFETEISNHNLKRKWQLAPVRQHRAWSSRGGAQRDVGWTRPEFVCGGPARLPADLPLATEETACKSFPRPIVRGPHLQTGDGRDVRLHQVLREGPS